MGTVVPTVVGDVVRLGDRALAGKAEGFDRVLENRGAVTHRGTSTLGWSGKASQIQANPPLGKGPLSRGHEARETVSIVALSLEARNVEHRYRGALALDGVSIDVPEGGMIALVGESGSGKTTLLRSFNGLVQPDAGTVRVGGQDVRDMSPIALRRRIGYVPQHGGLLPHWGVLRNVALVPRLAGSADSEAAAEDALARVALDPAGFGHRLPRELSGGQRQRVAIARALAAHQEVVLLDEPFGALDTISRGELQEAFARLRQEIGFTALLVTHDLAEAARLAETIVVMRAGQIEQTGTIGEIRHAPATPYVRTLFECADATATALASA